MTGENRVESHLKIPSTRSVLITKLTDSNISVTFTEKSPVSEREAICN